MQRLYLRGRVRLERSAALQLVFIVLCEFGTNIVGDSADRRRNLFPSSRRLFECRELVVRVGLQNLDFDRVGRAALF